MSSTCARCFDRHDGECSSVVRPPIPVGASTPPPDFNPELPAGLAVGEYVIEAKIGDGGFGTVYRATHPVIGKSAAVKVLRHEFSSNPEMVHRFVSEARAVNKIRHKNIIDIFSFGQLPDGRRFYVMELLEGRTLDDLLNQTARCEPSIAIPILAGIARALDAAHTCGVVHRDLKPENVYLVRGEDGHMQVKLLDFGIAKLHSAGGMTTRAGVAMGTPHYMSPEQWRGHDVDHRTDVYAFGVVAYRLLTGTLPYDAQAPMDIMVKQTGGPPPRPSEVSPDVASAFDEPLLRMLERDAANRPSSVLLGFEALERAVGLNAPVRTPDYAQLSAMASVDLASVRFAATVAVPVATGVPSSNTIRSSPPSPPRSRAVALALAAVMIAAVAAGTVLIAVSLRAKARTAAAPTAPAPLVTEVPASRVVPAPVSTEVSVVVTAVPPNVEVYAGSERLGVAPGPILLKKGTAPITLSLRAPGFDSEELQVASDRDSAISAKLHATADSSAAPVEPAPRRAPRSGAPAGRPQTHGKDSLEAF